MEALKSWVFLGVAAGPLTQGAFRKAGGLIAQLRGHWAYDHLIVGAGFADSGLAEGLAWDGGARASTARITPIPPLRAARPVPAPGNERARRGLQGETRGRSSPWPRPKA